MRKSIVLAALLASVGAGGSPAKSPGPVAFRDRVYGVSFSRPSGWKAYDRSTIFVDYEVLVVALSTQPLRVPCRPNHGCGWQGMLSALAPGGVAALWLLDESPLANPSVDSYLGTPARIGGMAAKILVQPADAGEICPPGTTGSVTAFVSAPAHRGHWIVSATNGMSFTRFQAQVMAMLRSARF